MNVFFGLVLFACHVVTAQAATHSGNTADGDVWAANEIHIITGGVSVPANTTLIIEAGAIVKFNTNTYLQVIGTLNAVGTTANKILFTSAKDDSLEAGGDTNGDADATIPARGDWSYLYFNGTGSNASIMSHAEVRYGGGGNVGAVYTYNSSVEINNCHIHTSKYQGVHAYNGSPVLSGNTIENNSKSGIYLNGATPTITGNLIQNNTSYGIEFTSANSTLPTANNQLKNNGVAARLPLSALPVPGNENTLDGNTRNLIELFGGGTSGDVTLSAIGNVGGPMVYGILSSVTVSSGTTLTIEAGTVLKFSTTTFNPTYLNVSGTLNAAGISGNEIMVR